MNSYKDFLLIEVIPAKVDDNQTVSTAVSVSKLQHQHRRSRRSAEKANSLDFDLDVVDISGDTGRLKVIILNVFDDNVYLDIYPFFLGCYFYTISSFLSVNGFSGLSALEQCQVRKVTQLTDLSSKIRLSVSHLLNQRNKHFKM